jgi:nucleoside-diphosphate-sugar epimerase
LYVQHKLDMESMVRTHPGHLILRVPQLAGRTDNRHTLLGYLRERILRGEGFVVWSGAERNVIDVEDVAKVAVDLVTVECIRGDTVNVASDRSVAVVEVVRVLEDLLGRKAAYQLLEKGEGMHIDTSRATASFRRCGITFDDEYLRRILYKYYAHESS